jgi:hypothetical protein
MTAPEMNLQLFHNQQRPQNDRNWGRVGRKKRVKPEPEGDSEQRPKHSRQVTKVMDMNRDYLSLSISAEFSAERARRNKSSLLVFKV